MLSYRLQTGLAISIAAMLGVGCRASAADSKPAVAQQGSASDSSARVLATIGDEKITLGTVRGRAGETLDELDAQYRQTRDKLISSALDSVVRDRLFADEAKKQGKTPTDLVTATVAAAGDPSDAEIADWYKENQIRVGTQTLEQVKPQIANLLQKQRRADALDKLDQRLRAERKVAINFQPERFHFKNEGAPTLGKAGAPVTLVEFSDFQCPYCRATAPTLKQVRQKYGDRVQIVYRQFPLTSIHPFAFKAAEASLCANEQGRFWELHDAMFADQTKLAVTELKGTARRIGMDEAKFGSCLDSGRYTAQVRTDEREGQLLGINGTPALFINGVYIEGGAVPFSTLASLIDRELGRSAR
jgi:protein-disulfide isomerase